MEPMTLGSPVASPHSPGGTGASSPFLPSYLMGDSMTASGSKSSSPTKPFKHVTFGTPPTLSSPSEGRAQRNIHFGFLQPQDKSSGPPTKGLFDSLDETFSSPKPSGSLDPAFQEMTDCLMNIPTPTRQRDQDGLAITSRSFDKKQSSDDTWVTVFGFQPLSPSFIESQLTRYGTIVDKRIPKEGNWIHLRFKTPMKARAALKSNGRVYPGSIMVGVVPCRDEEVLKLSSGSKENRALNDSDCYLFDDSRQTSKVATSGTPVPHNSTFGTPTQADSSNLYLGTPVRISSIRPLNQAYRTAQAVNEVQGETGTPQKSSSMVTKAMEYVFGW